MERDAPSLSGEWKRILADLAELADGAIEWDQLDAALAEIRSLGAARIRARRPFQPNLPTLPGKHERSEVDQLERELAARQLELVALHSDVGRFERRYVRVCGRLLVEFDDLDAEIARLKSQAAPGDLVLKDAARQADERASESREAAATVDTSESPVGDVTPDLRRLYREVARRVHPDLAVDEAERQRHFAFTVETNAAYEARDTASLAALAQRVREGAPVSEPSGRSVRLRLAIARVRLGLEILRVSDIHALWERSCAARTQHGVDLIAALARETRVDINAARRRVVKLRATGRAEPGDA